MSARNESMIVSGQLYDMDKVSLYPTAMCALEGCPKGPPKVFYNSIPAHADYFIVQIDILCVEGKAWDFPILALRSPDATNEWTNDIEGQRCIIGRQTLEDLIDWHTNFTYTVINGYYWDQGYNTQLAPVIQSMYDKRAELKRDHNPSQLIFKLLLNSSYGRTGLKPIQVCYSQCTNLIFGQSMDYYVHCDKIHRFIANNFYRISEMVIMPNGDTRRVIVNVLTLSLCRVVASKAINRHFNQQHVVTILTDIFLPTTCV